MKNLSGADEHHASNEQYGAFVEHVSTEPFASTLQCIEQAIRRADLTIFARIDHAEAARSIGLAMPATTVLIYGNPRGGTPVMLAAPRAALDLPLRVLIREDDQGRTCIGFHPIVDVLREANVAESLAARLAPAQAVLVEGTPS
jgi:uncharacterized protein (DUF302 family)